MLFIGAMNLSTTMAIHFLQNADSAGSDSCDRRVGQGTSKSQHAVGLADLSVTSPVTELFPRATGRADVWLRRV